MFWRAVLAFLAMPGMVAFAVPALWLASIGRHLAYPAGLAIWTVGVIGLLWCVRDFYVQGKGTLAPWEPPTQLVTVGLYRFSRNPMYVSVALILLGWATAFASTGLAIYTLVVVAAFYLRVVFGEEPYLARTHGEQWAQYVAQVPRWFGVRRKGE